MNYYIQGDAANADKIKAAFEKLGYDTSFVQKLSASDSHILFTLPCDTRVHAFHTAYIEADILKRLVGIDPDYKELELAVKPKLKVEDWVVNKDGKPFSNGSHFMQISDIVDDYQIWFTSGTWTNRYSLRLWSIDDAKDGDVLVTKDYIFIFKYILYGGVHLYCHYDVDDEEFELAIQDAVIGNIHDKGAHFQPATKEQRDLLFKKMKEAGYEWDEKKKELSKIKPHYNIANFKPFNKVLVRDEKGGIWFASLFGNYHAESQYFDCVGGDYKQCIPFNDDTKHLLGTTDMCDEQYINW